MSDPHRDLQNWLAPVVADLMRKVGEARERACEASIQSGVYGVLETWSPGGVVGESVSLGVVTFELTAEVPCGCIHVRDERLGGGSPNLRSRDDRFDS